MLLTPLDIDIDQLKDKLGIGDIHNTLKAMHDRILKLSNPSHSTESVQSSPVSSQFDPAEDLMAQDCEAGPDISSKTLESSEFLSSIFEETEKFGPEVAEAIAL